MSWPTHDELARSFREPGATGKRRCPVMAVRRDKAALSILKVERGSVRDGDRRERSHAAALRGPTARAGWG
jgi:hypothetical protein